MTKTHSEFLPLALTLSRAKSWEDFTRTLMLAGKALPAMPPQLKQDATSVKGCESPVWLAYVETTSENDARFFAFSPSKVIRGVLAVLLEKANSMEQAQRRDFDFDTYLEACQLQRYMSESRGNGIKAVVEKLKAY